MARVRAADELPADAMVSLRLGDGGETSLPLRQVQARQVIAAVPWRKTRSARGQAHYPGYFWSATMGAHVIYESRLELARLLLADFDRGVVAITAQPFLLQARVGGRARRHVPDFLLVHADRSVRESCRARPCVPRGTAGLGRARGRRAGHRQDPAVATR